ncbi:MAG: hypothetical protein J6X18_04030 [Bacteroidales bacterium]|nr:hypothetical protein [Bacteroidales bacterium]
MKKFLLFVASLLCLSSYGQVTMERYYDNLVLKKNVWDAGSNYQYSERLGYLEMGDEISVHIEGIPERDIAGITIAVVDAQYQLVSEYYYEVDENIPANKQWFMDQILIIEQTASNCMLQISTWDKYTEGVNSIKIEKIPDYTDIVLTKNFWDEGSNYQYVVELGDVQEGMLYKATVCGFCSTSIDGLQMVLVDGTTYECVAEYNSYVAIARDISEGDSIGNVTYFYVTKDCENCKFIISTMDEVIDGVDEINLSSKYNHDQIFLEFSSLTFVHNEDNNYYQTEYDIEDVKINDDVIIEVKGVPSKDIEGFNVFILDENNQPITSPEPMFLNAKEGVAEDEMVFIHIKKKNVTNGKIVFQSIDKYQYGVWGFSIIPIPLDYTDITLKKNVWETGSNYQYEEDWGVVSIGDIYSINIHGFCDHAVSELQMALVDGNTYEDISGYWMQIATDISENDSIGGTFTFIVDRATENSKLIVNTKGIDVEDGLDEIKIVSVKPENNGNGEGGENGNGGEENPETAISSVGNESAVIENGIIYSKQIEVYNIAGQKVASCFNQLDTKNLKAGVIYYILTNEGMLKFSK